jgi:AcrR family transcriptional regulator
MIGGPEPNGRARTALVDRLRVRREEIDEAIFERVRDRAFDSAGSGDPEYVAGLRVATVAALDYALAGIELQDEAWEISVPGAVVVQARRAARAGVGLETVVRRYVAGYALLEQFVIREAVAQEPRSKAEERPDSGVLGGVLQRAAVLVQRLIGEASSAYAQELATLGGAEADGRASLAQPCGADGTASAVAGAPLVHTSLTDGLAAETDGPVVKLRRDRLLDAMARVLAERGWRGTSVGLVCASARVSRNTFYRLFPSGLQECLLALMDDGERRVHELIVSAFAGRERWQDAAREALASLLCLLDDEPALARALFLEALGAGVWAHERRDRHVASLTALSVVHWIPSGEMTEHVARGAVESALAAIRSHLVSSTEQPLVTLLPRLMALLATPYVDRQALRLEVRTAQRLTQTILASRRNGSSDQIEQTAQIPRLLCDPRAVRARACLCYVCEHPGASNREIAGAVGVTSDAHISTLLARIHALGLLCKLAGPPGGPNAWVASAYGRRVIQVLRVREPLPAQLGVERRAHGDEC